MAYRLELVINIPVLDFPASVSIVEWEEATQSQLLLVQWERKREAPGCD